MSFEGFAWRLVPGDNLLEVREDSLHLAQRGPASAQHLAAASAAFAATESPLWKIGFRARFGMPQASGTVLRVLAGATQIGLVGADRSFGGIGAFVTGQPNRHLRKTDMEWHRYDFIGNGKEAWLYVDGQRTGGAAAPGRPDSLTLGPIAGSAGQQTSAWLRDVQIAPSPGGNNGIDLFNGVDLTGWITAGIWEVKDGMLRNVSGGPADGLFFCTAFDNNEFVLTLRVRFIDGLRPRFWITPAANHLANESGFYFGHEGDPNQLAMYGHDLSPRKDLGDRSYAFGEWNDLRLEVDADGHAALFKNSTLIQTATRTQREPLWIGVHAGDGWSPGHLEIAAMRLWVR